MIIMDDMDDAEMESLVLEKFKKSLSADRFGGFFMPDVSRETQSL